jgi:thioredoxin reductase (NADPH)
LKVERKYIYFLINRKGDILEERDIIIIGSGPAGLTAAIYISRAGYDPLLIEGVPSGGQLLTTTEIENFPGFPDGISGPQLIDNMKKQAQRFGTQFLMKNVTAVDFKSYPFFVRAEENEYSAKAVIIATGAQARSLDLPCGGIQGKGDISLCNLRRLLF